MGFDFTDYYAEEMGENLNRRFVSFERLIDPEKLASIKRKTCSMEKKFSEKGSRTVNIDPGYITLAKVVLASTKNFFHRIYIGKGIYAEITLAWQKGEYKTFRWTFPDYATEKYMGILKDIRDIYSIQIKSEKKRSEKKYSKNKHLEKKQT
jgi:hypothetical protein